MGWLTETTDALGLTDVEGAKDAATRSSQALQAAGQQGIETLRGFYSDAQGNLAPYMQAGTGALGTAVDLLGGRRFEKTAAEQQMIDDALERVNREAAYSGGLGGGQRLKRLYQTGLGTEAQIRDNLIARQLGVAGMGQSAASNLAGLGMGAGQGIAGLQTDIGSAQASGILGRQQAGNQATELLMQGLGAAAGFAMG